MACKKGRAVGNLDQSKVNWAQHILEVKIQGELNKQDSLKIFTMSNNNKFVMYISFSLIKNHFHLKNTLLWTQIVIFHGFPLNSETHWYFMRMGSGANLLLFLLSGLICHRLSKKHHLNGPFLGCTENADFSLLVYSIDDFKGK